MSLGLSIIFGVGYVLILRLLKDKKYQASAVSILLLCTVTSEIALGNTNHYSMNQNKTNYTSDYDDFRTLKKELDDYDSNGILSYGADKSPHEDGSVLVRLQRRFGILIDGI